TVLLNASAVLDMAVPDGGVEREQLEWIARSAEQMARLISDLLDVSSIEAGEFSVALGPRPVGRRRREALERGRRLAREKELRGEGGGVGAARPPRATPHRSPRVLGNLLGNAIKFSPRGGRASLWAEAVEGEVRFTVSDTGSGVP